MGSGLTQQVRRLTKELEGEGWEVSLTKSGHYRLRSPYTNRLVFCASTPGDWRAFKNIIRDLKREGYQMKEIGK